MGKFHLIRSLLVLFCVAAISTVASAQIPTPILQYSFNETGTTAASTGSIPTPLTLLNAGGIASDLHSADGLGVSGLPGDKAFDNTESTGMGDGSTGGVAVLPAYTTGTLTSFTFQCWYKVPISIDNGARFFEDKYISLQGFPGYLVLYVNTLSVSSATSYGQTNEWVFLAVTYDGTQTGNNVVFYVGTKTTPVVQVGTVESLDGGPVIQDDQILSIANYNTKYVRPVDGYIDDVRLFGSASDNTGVLTPAQLETLRQRDIADGEDTLAKDTVSLSGTIIQETGINGETTVKPATIANVLKVLGVSGAPAADTLRYYYDTTLQSYVIAPKSDLALGFGFPLATVLSLGGNGVTWNPSSHSGIAAYDLTGMDNDLSGAALSNSVFPAAVETDTIHSTLFGNISGLQTIMESTVVDVFKDTR